MLVPVALSLDDANVAFLGLDNQAVAFSAMVIVWSLGASAQGPALTALAQEMAPATAKATAMALPRATGDGTYIVAPFSLASLPIRRCRWVQNVLLPVSQLYVEYWLWRS
jgi:hypothetical protein